MSIRIGILGYGNLGRGAECALSPSAVVGRRIRL